jgi:hypothetical protein
VGYPATRMAGYPRHLSPYNKENAADSASPGQLNIDVKVSTGSGPAYCIAQSDGLLTGKGFLEWVEDRVANFPYNLLLPEFHIPDLGRIPLFG